MRVNPDDIMRIKEKAKRLGVKYQTFIAAILHRVARS
jgi:predicted DNA binding CopG/RHH family protein